MKKDLINPTTVSLGKDSFLKRIEESKKYHRNMIRRHENEIKNHEDQIESLIRQEQRIKDHNNVDMNEKELKRRLAISKK